MVPTGGYAEFINSLLFAYNIWNMQHPTECPNIYIFMQRKFLQVFDNKVKVTYDTYGKTIYKHIVKTQDSCRCFYTIY
jgi:hypothetical protein